MAEASDLRKANRLSEASVLFKKSAQWAELDHDPQAQSRALLGAAGCYIRLFRYPEALHDSEAALQLALQANDNSLAGAAAGNKSTIYLQLGDFQAAARTAEESVSFLRHSSNKGFLARALSSYGDAEAELDAKDVSAAAFQESIRVAKSASLDNIEAEAEEHLGKNLLDQGDLPGAEKALEEARRLATKNHESDALAVTESRLSELAFRKKKYEESLRLLNQVLRSHSLGFSAIPRYWPVQLRGEVLLAMNRPNQALAAFQEAVDLAASWRQNELPGDVTRTRTVVELHSVYQDYVDLAARTALVRHDPVLARRALEVLAQNRAASLREEMLSTLGREMRLPPRYFELLSQLQTLQAAVTLGSNSNVLQANKLKLQRIRLELADLENQIGIRQKTISIKSEKDSHKNSLRDIQLSLNRDELLLSFSLGRDRSFLWAVSDDQVSLYQLPSEGKISLDVKAYSQAVRRNSAWYPEGLLLDQELFGQLPERLARRQQWILAADGVLLNSVPFASLPDNTAVGSNHYLAQSHALRFVPSELMLPLPEGQRPARRLLGVADPIYNFADSRYPRSFSFSLLPVRRNDGPVALARLVGSGREAETAGAASGMNQVEILSGSAASAANLRTALAKDPEIIHFAVHVVSPEASGNHEFSEEAALALSLTPDGMPELLTKETIASLHVPGSLVVLSGCASQQGESLPSVGLVGLSRAWLLAGASAVVVSAWPTPDDSGTFFSAFYRNLHAQTEGSGNLAQRAAIALQKAELEMQRSTSYRNAPSFWAAYSLISKE